LKGKHLISNCSYRLC